MTIPHSPATPSGADEPCTDAFSVSKRLQEPSVGLFKALLRQLHVWNLKREARKCMASFFEVSDALGMDPYSSRLTPEQVARLARVHAIRAELTELNYSSLKTRP